jgi:hypothetical protein
MSTRLDLQRRFISTSARVSLQFVLFTVVVSWLSVPFAHATGMLSIDWQRQIGTNVDDIAHDIAVDAAGNSYIGGNTAGNLNGQSNNGQRDAFQLSLDAVGADRWTRLYGALSASSDEEGYGVAANPSGLSALTGFTTDVMFGTHHGQSDVYGARINSATGGVLVGSQIGTPAFDNGQGAAFAGNDDLYYVGQTSGTSFLGETGDGSSQAYIYKQTSTGSIPWARLLGTSATELAADVAVTTTGGAVLTGFTSGSLVGASAGSNDAFVAQFDSAGTQQWVAQLGSTGSDNAWGVGTDATGNVYIAGDAGGSLGGQTFHGGFSDAFVAKFNSAGAFQWARLLGDAGNDTAQAIAVDALGNSYITGWTDGNIGGPNLGLTDTFLAKYDTSGNLLWTHQIGTTNRDEAEGIALLGDRIYIAGTAFSPFTGGHQGGRDVFAMSFIEATIPEPASIVLGVIAMALLGAERRRRRR